MTSTNGQHNGQHEGEFTPTNNAIAGPREQAAVQRGADVLFSVVSRGWEGTLNALPPPAGTVENVRRAWDITANAMLSRAAWMTALLDPRRDVYQSCGLPKVITQQMYVQLYQREAVAAKVVDVLPLLSWQVSPELYETEDGEEPTGFEQDWDALGTTLRGERSWFKADDRGHPLWEWCRKADVQSRIGQYGVMLLGLDDVWEAAEVAERGMDPAMVGMGKPLAEPAVFPNDGEGVDKPERKLLYVRVFPEHMAAVTKLEDDPSSPRYGHPVEYSINFANPTLATGGFTAAPSMAQQTQNVHWTRVVHVVDGDGTNPVYGPPAMQAVFNNLLALMKLYHGDAEGFWVGAFPLISIETANPLAGEPGAKLPMDELKTMMFNLFNDVQRWIGLKGMTAKSIAPMVVSPREHIDVQVEAVCIKLDIPKRVFMGSERGELASSQDDAQLNDVIRARETGHCTNAVVVPLVDRLIQLGCLRAPKDRYHLAWPSLDSQTAAEKANIAKVKADTVAAVANVYDKLESQGAMTWRDVFVKFLDMTPDEVDAMLAAAEEARLAREEEAMARFEEQQRMAAESGQAAFDQNNPNPADGAGFDTGAQDTLPGGGGNNGQPAPNGQPAATAGA